MDFKSISESGIWDNILSAELRMNAEQLRFWESIKISPQQWSQTPYGGENGFWAVGIIGEMVLWFNDIEDGYNISRYTKFGTIDEYCCNQDELEVAIQSLLNLIQKGYSLTRFGPPIPVHQLNKQ